MTVIRWDATDPDRVLDAVLKEYSAGRPVVVPTDTLYGLSAPISNPDALMYIFQVKGRPLDMTLPVAVGDLSALEELAHLELWKRDHVHSRLPGPYTFILRSRSPLDRLVSRNNTVAVRIPAHPLFRVLCSKVGPLALTSANPHGECDLTRADDIDSMFGGDLLVIEDDRSLSGAASAMLDLTGDRPLLLRPGKTDEGVENG
ncbi:MAG: L-threonylcarbamoyladenylate synthase [Candidatus Thermoplasmatota archaeon]|nr:L-threonylcarbamoyladenylate synthase [Candidatus Thermoplasmatota archaeon]